MNVSPLRLLERFSYSKDGVAHIFKELGSLPEDAKKIGYESLMAIKQRATLFAELETLGELPYTKESLEQCFNILDGRRIRGFLRELLTAVFAFLSVCSLVVLVLGTTSLTFGGDQWGTLMAWVLGLSVVTMFVSGYILCKLARRNMWRVEVMLSEYKGLLDTRTLEIVTSVKKKVPDADFSIINYYQNGMTQYSFLMLQYQGIKYHINACEGERKQEQLLYSLMP